ncbi:hypothetical protein [Limnohabitans radicicola]|uniref:Uncharacterized protein n=1 Tax=Limnohabitans radicicola TaxID=2771427 RepID=A0A927FKG6_9BURK|nr:hypothetical protein [Limnohabitans radicicola]MBD8051732.1 hypothetical protein [Limnohabitans radicicola]
MTRATFSCPFCCSDVPLQASVCSHCTRDLALFKPLALQMHELSDQVEQLKAVVQEQQTALAELKSHDIGALALAISEQQQMAPTAPAPPASTSVKPSWWALFAMVLMTVALVGLSHWVLLFVYDSPPVALRLLTITLPALTGYVCARQSGMGAVVQWLTAAVTGVASVWLMLWITSTIDGVPLWPNNPRDWRETFEYMAAISLAFFTGHLLHRFIQHWSKQQQNRISLSVLLERDEKGQFKIAEVTRQVQNLVTAMAPVVSAGTALYSGLKVFTGN